MPRRFIIINFPQPSKPAFKGNLVSSSFQPAWWLQSSAAVELEITARGGHVGFVQGKLPGRADYWLEGRIPEFLKSRLAQA
jgi:predicted alpha/beta-fold hydrolase